MSTPQFYSDLLGAIEALRIRPMFGGYGVYSGEFMFGLIDDGDLYFKVDDTTRPDFQTLGSAPFSYDAKGKTNVITSYWRVPEAILEDTDRLNDWVARAITVARVKKFKSPAANKAKSPSEFGGLGSTSRTWLAEIGVHNMDDLKFNGAIASYAALKAKYPKRVSLNLLWGLYALVNDIDIKAVDEETKSHLKSLLRHPATGT